MDVALHPTSNFVIGGSRFNVCYFVYPTTLWQSDYYVAQSDTPASELRELSYFYYSETRLKVPRKFTENEKTIQTETIHLGT